MIKKAVNVGFIYNDILNAAKAYCGERYKDIVVSILKDLEVEFKNAYCAESVHHDYKGGLIEHTQEVLALCLSVADLFDGIDIELLVAGAILHDIGKIYTYKEKDDFKAEKTYRGELEEHLYIGAEKINEYKDKVKSSLDLSLLKHMILSHHGKREWGSPVIPKTKEADIVHQCDMTSSRIAIYNKRIEESKNDDMFTEKDSFLGGKIYKGVMINEE